MRDRRSPREPIAPRLERLEGRDLPSAALYLASARLRQDQTAQVGDGTAIDPGLGAPTARERRREHFVAKFTASYITGPPQFTGEALRTSLVARRGGSNQFLHGVALVAINTPADPSAPITRAIAAIDPQNTATTGSTLVLDLNGAPAADSRRPPSRFTWTVNGSSGGLYANAVATTPGTLVIRYTPTRSLPGGFEQGTATLVFRGAILTTGTGDIARANL